MYDQTICAYVAMTQSDNDSCPQLGILRGRDGPEGIDGMSRTAGPQVAKEEREDPGGSSGTKRTHRSNGTSRATGTQGTQEWGSDLCQVGEEIPP